MPEFSLQPDLTKVANHQSLIPKSALSNGDVSFFVVSTHLEWEEKYKQRQPN